MSRCGFTARHHRGSAAVAERSADIHDRGNVAKKNATARHHRRGSAVKQCLVRENRGGNPPYKFELPTDRLHYAQRG